MCDNKKIEMEDVINIMRPHILRQSAGELQAVCPHCGDTRGKFYISLSKNACYCHHCNFRGGTLDYYKELNPLNNYDDNKAVCREIYQLLDSGSVKSSNEGFLKIDKDIDLSIERASDEYCSRVYRALLKELVLNPEHKADLIKRGLNDEQIEKFLFRSTPESSYKVCRNLQKKGLSLEGVPGFYEEKNGNWNLKIPTRGYLCPVFDGERNLLIGFQIRADVPINNNKYMWISSNSKNKGVSSGAPSTCLPGEKQSAVIVVEGILKATICYLLMDKQVTVIGVPGVNSLKGLKPYLERYNGISYFFEAYDMDKHLKIDESVLMGRSTEDNLSDLSEEEQKRLRTIEKVSEATGNLLSLITSYNVDVHQLKWDSIKKDDTVFWKGQYKGLDDFLAGYENRQTFVDYLIKKAKENLSMRNFFVA